MTPATLTGKVRGRVASIHGFFMLYQRAFSVVCGKMIA